MQTMKSAILRGGLGAALLLCSCAMPYQEATWYHGGYSDLRIDSNTASVSFTGDVATPWQRVESFLIYRCAEITRQSGYDYFIIVSRSIEATPTSSVGPGYYNTANVGIATTSGGMVYEPAYITGGYYPGWVPAAYGAGAVIKMFKGAKPADNLNAYYAEDVIRHLGPQIMGD